MTRTAVAILIPLAALAACGKGNSIEEKNASVGDVAEAVAKARPDLKFKPGRWESNVEFLSVDAPGMPPEVAKAMQGAIGKDKSYYSCLTKEQAEKPGADFFNKGAQNCKYEHFTMGKGVIDAKMVCGPGPSGKASVEMKGDYAPDHYSMTMATRADAGPQGSMTMHMKIDSKHVGQCTGNESKAG